MTQHRDEVYLRHMLEHAREAISIQGSLSKDEVAHSRNMHMDRNQARLIQLPRWKRIGDDIQHEVVLGVRIGVQQCPPQLEEGLWVVRVLLAELCGALDKLVQGENFSLG